MDVKQIGIPTCTFQYLRLKQIRDLNKLKLLPNGSKAKTDSCSCFTQMTCSLVLTRT